jgi:hypothetical protein
MIPNIENRFLGKAMRGKILSAMINLIGTFSMIRLAAAACSMRRRMPSFAFGAVSAAGAQALPLARETSATAAALREDRIERVIAPGR